MPSEMFPRSLIRKLESADLPLQALDAIRQLRGYLDDLEATRMLKARELGASSADIAKSLGITRQAVYNKLRALERHHSADETVVIPVSPRPGDDGLN